MKYMNGYRDLFILTFPYTMNKLTYTLLKDEANREIKVSKNIAIVTTLQDENHILLQQLTNNNIFFYQTTNEELINTINKINKECVLIITSPAIIVNDLTDDFISMFETLSGKFIFGGTTKNPLGINYLGSEELHCGVNQYLDSSVMFGSTNEVKKYFSKYNYNKDSKLVSDVATLITNYNSVREHIDTDGAMFQCVDFEETQIKENNDNRYVETINNGERRLF